MTVLAEWPASDADVPAWWAALGLPGLIDIHVHFMPDSVLRKVWAYFDAAGPLVGREWPITYRSSEAERLAVLHALGVRRFPSLLYPHKPGMAEWLNSWSLAFAADHPEVIPTATFFPEPGALAYVRSAIEAGARLFKVHVQVGGFDPRDPLLDPVWGLLAEARVPAVVHAGHMPAPGAFTGPQPIGEVLARHPQLPLIAAHMGGPDFDEFIGFVERYDRVMLDTTMVFTDFGVGGRSAALALGRRLSAKLLEHQDRVLLGTDFPNIPYPYSHQLAALQRLELGDDWLRAVCWTNGARLLNLEE